ncbi:MAG: type I DNA topoisomerase [Rickettsiales bacterium]|nr:type I DNA topoisomerase [Rickettsiales bacterium]
MTQHVVVVESPAKSKTINKYLGKDYTVLASFGHVRDLPSKDGSVNPDDDFAMLYEVDGDSKKHVNEIAKAVKGAETLYLATDPDREGEAISWHVLEALQEKKALKKDTQIKRIVFHEITKSAVTSAIESPRDIDMNLVNAQQARRALDYLVGFNLSPVLWRKLPGSRSAGRVQSVALRLICEREQEIEQFTPQEFWDVTLNLKTEKGEAFQAKLSQYEGEKLEKFSITNEEQAKGITAALKSKNFAVSSVTPKQQRRNPYAPFSTSTLQMDASRKLGFSAKRTMQVAQKLYEGITLDGETVGLITYMRTDGITVAQEALNEARNFIGSEYGDNYLPKSPRMFKTKSKNAQEAHEAIRPTSISRKPESIAKFLDADQQKLYDLIWKRMVASQMEPAVYDQVAVELTANDNQAVLRTTGSVLRFDGFLKLYQIGQDEDEEKEENRRLPDMQEGNPVSVDDILPEQHFTNPPPRYTEASLVKRMEELGIGRPSTYASIISVLIDRKYVVLDKKRFIAQSLGRLVTAFLVNFFERYVQYDFTAELEDTLDDVADGEKNWKEVLKLFWVDFIAKVEDSQKLSTTDVLETLDKVLEPYIFHDAEDIEKARVCPTCGTGRLSLKTGKFGAFLGCSNYPDCTFTRQIVGGEEDDSTTESGEIIDYPKILGTDPDTDEDITLRKGPYGVYVQLGTGSKPKRASLPKGVKPEEMTFERALSLLQLPREVGAHPETGDMITAGIGRYGPYLLHQKVYTSLPAEDDVLTVGMNRAVTLIAENSKKKGNTPIKVLGKHPEDNEEIAIFSGRYGPYVKYKKINATIPKGKEPEDVTLEEALELIAAKASAPKKKKTTRKKKAS